MVFLLLDTVLMPLLTFIFSLDDFAEQPIVEKSIKTANSVLILFIITSLIYSIFTGYSTVRILEIALLYRSNTYFDIKFISNLKITLHSYLVSELS